MKHFENLSKSVILRLCYAGDNLSRLVFYFLNQPWQVNITDGGKTDGYQLHDGNRRNPIRIPEFHPHVYDQGAVQQCCDVSEALPGMYAQYTMQGCRLLDGVFCFVLARYPVPRWPISKSQMIAERCHCFYY